MKYTIHGFSQQKAYELGLDSNDLLILRWLVDFSGTSKMRTFIENGKFYFWINYQSVLEDLPILRISKQTLYKKHFYNLCNCHVLEHKHIKDGGSFSYYTYGENYDMLVYSEQPLVKNTEGVSEFTQGCVRIYQPPTSEFTNPLRQNLPNKDPSISNPSITDKSTSNQEYINCNAETDVDIVQTKIDDEDINKQGLKNDTYLEERKQITEYLNEKAGTSYRHNSSLMKKHANARLNEGYSVDDFKKVIDKKVAEWLNDPKYAKYLRPETLFGTKFENYLNQKSGVLERKYERGDDSL